MLSTDSSIQSHTDVLPVAKGWVKMFYRLNHMEKGDCCDNVQTLFISNSEAKASELLEDLEELFPRHYMQT